MEQSENSSRKLKTTTDYGYHISTIERKTRIGYSGVLMTSYECCAWEFKEGDKELGKWVVEEYSNSEEEILKIHDMLVSYLAKGKTIEDFIRDRQLKD